MKINTHPCRVVVGLALGILVASASIATAQVITVTPSCTSYTITLSANGQLLPGPQTFNYSIVATPTSGPSITITDAIFIDTNLAGTTTLTKPLGPLNGAYTFTGTFVGGPQRTGTITFNPSSLSCATPFATSSAKLEIAQLGFDLNESFTLGANSNGINPVTENVTLQIGTFSVTIPAGSFQLNPNGRFAFQGVINGVSMQVQIVPLSNNMFTFKAEGTGVDLTGLFNPVTVVLTIGDDFGSTSVTAQFQ